MLLLCALLVELSSTEDPLRAVLRSPRASLKLYSRFKKSNHLRFVGWENSQRYRLFLASAGHVADYNEDKTDTGHYGINKFSVMSEEEKRAYHGLNFTTSEDEEMVLEERSPLQSASSENLPHRVLWTDSESVTEVQDQGSCGSCWAFAAVASIETRYKLLSGILRRFSEQEYLDCVYEEYGFDGCHGGGNQRSFLWSKKNGGRLAAAKDRPYEGKDKKCRSSWTPDGMKALKITGYGRVRRSERDHLIALQTGAVTAAVVVTDKFHQYDGSIMKDNTCKWGDAKNHAIAMVGYSTSYLLIKNSWGSDWGDKGFMKVARNHHNCQLYTYTRYPLFGTTSVRDNNPDPATDYRPTNENTPTKCADQDEEYCINHLKRLGCCDNDCTFLLSFSEEIRLKMLNNICPKTCEICGNAVCPGGTVECSDGICRHEHMCL